MAFLLVLSSCDDGDLTIEEVSFEDVPLQRCNSNPYLLYKINGGESIILYLPQSGAFTDEATNPGEPRVYPINNTNRLIYRSYRGNINQSNICDVIPPATPTVAEEWTATSGTIEITTTAVVSDNPQFPGGQRITGFRHSIMIRNLDFLKPDGTSQFYLEYSLNDFVSTGGVTNMPFAFDDNLQICGGNRVFKYVNNEALTLDIDPALIVSEVTTTPRVGYTSASTNRLSYRLFANAPLTADYFCASPVPTLPNITQEWVADQGEGESGRIEVTTTTSGPGVFVHEIHLKNARLRRGNTSFLLASDYLLGYLTTN